MRSAPGPDKPTGSVAATPVPQVPPPSAVTRGPDGQLVRVFSAPVERTWAVAQSVLRSLGWDIDQEDRQVGWMRTDSRYLEGENYGVYAKGTRQRLRLVVKSLDSDRTQVTVERRVWKHERILWMDKEEDLPEPNQDAEKQVLDGISAAL